MAKARAKKREEEEYVPILSDAIFHVLINYGPEAVEVLLRKADEVLPGGRDYTGPLSEDQMVALGFRRISD